MGSKCLMDGLRVLTQLTSTQRLAVDPLKCFAPRWSRSLATEVQLPLSTSSKYAAHSGTGLAATDNEPWKPPPPVTTTIYSFPSMEPLRFEQYPAYYLGVPLRRDILHRAVIYEGDKTRQGTASTKWRKDVHGSGRKIRPQKGTGQARLGDKKSPMLRGGGVAHGPHPRDFSTELPRKIYDLAWRTALSYRYSKGELIIVEDGANLAHASTGLVVQIFEKNHWGRLDGRSLVITAASRRNLVRALRNAGEHGRVLQQKEVDVKDLLEQGRLIIEKGALDGILQEHQSDIAREIATAVRPAVS